MALHDRYADQGPALDGMKKGLEAQNQTVQKIMQNPDIKPDQKRQLMDGLYFQMIKFANMGNKTLDELEKNVKH